ILIFLIHPLLGLVTLLGGAALLVMAWLTEFATQKPVVESTLRHHQMLRLSDSAHRNAEMVEAMGMTPALIRRWQEASEAMTFPQRLAGSRSAVISSASKTLRMVLQILITGVGAYLALKNQ